MNRFQKILDEAFGEESYDEDAIDEEDNLKEMHAELRYWAQTLDNVREVVGPDLWFIIKPKPMGSKTSDWDPQSDQLLDDGDEWEEENEDGILISLKFYFDGYIPPRSPQIKVNINGDYDNNKFFKVDTPVSHIKDYILNLISNFNQPSNI